jgi:hypothetical protein
MEGGDWRSELEGAGESIAITGAGVSYDKPLCFVWSIRWETLLSQAIY